MTKRSPSVLHSQTEHSTRPPRRSSSPQERTELHKSCSFQVLVHPLSSNSSTFQSYWMPLRLARIFTITSLSASGGRHESLGLPSEAPNAPIRYTIRDCRVTGSSPSRLLQRNRRPRSKPTAAIDPSYQATNVGRTTMREGMRSAIQFIRNSPIMQQYIEHELAPEGEPQLTKDLTDA